MPTDRVEDLSSREYKYGFVTDIEAEAAPPGLNEDIVRLISAKKKSQRSCWSGASKPIDTGSP